MALIIPSEQENGLTRLDACLSPPAEESTPSKVSDAHRLAAERAEERLAAQRSSKAVSLEKVVQAIITESETALMAHAGLPEPTRSEWFDRLDWSDERRSLRMEFDRLVRDFNQEIQEWGAPEVLPAR